MNDARLEQVRDWAINCVALAPFADVGDFVALGHGALDVIDAYEALRTQLAEAQRALDENNVEELDGIIRELRREIFLAQERETALRKALEEDLCPWHGPQPEAMKPYPFDQACGTKAFLVTKPCERARRALLGEQVNG